MKEKSKVIRATTVSISMNIILRDQLCFLNQYYDVVGVSSYDPKHSEELIKREGVKFIPVNMSRDIDLKEDLKALYKIYRVLKKESPDLIHTQTPKAGMLFMLAGKLAGVKFRIQTVGGTPLPELSGLKKRIVKAAEKLTYSCATEVWPNSRGLKEYLIDENLISSSHSKVIGNGSSNGVDINHFDPGLDFKEQVTEIRSKHEIAKDNFVFLFIGRIAEEKGIRELVSAFSQIKESHPGIKLLLVGPFENDFGKLDFRTTQQLKENDDIILAGRHDDVRPYLSLSNVLVLPSYREGFPNVVLQAGSMGLPSVVTNINGCNEIIEEGVNGLLVKKKSVESLKTKLKLILTDDVLRKRIKKNCRPKITEKFSREYILECYKREYDRLLKT